MLTKHLVKHVDLARRSDLELAHAVTGVDPHNASWLPAGPSTLDQRERDRDEHDPQPIAPPRRQLAELPRRNAIEDRVSPAAVVMENHARR
jgi:hypothetical protein